MRVLLINPYYPISETPSPPLGLAYLGAALENAGIQVKILDYVVYPYRRDVLEAILKDFKPHMTVVPAFSTLRLKAERWLILITAPVIKRDQLSGSNFIY